MDQLSDRQIFEMFRNLNAFHRTLRTQIRAEWDVRRLESEMFQRTDFEICVKETMVKPLAWKWRMLVMLLPIFLPVHLIAGARLMDGGYKRMFEDLYLFLAFGYGIWFVGFIAFVRIFGN